VYNKDDPHSLEMYSSAITLSDMEIFIFPELLYSLVLANIMSPRIWMWKRDPWFAEMNKMSPLRRLQRLKQFIMDHFAFNLDLDTWGLTTKEAELARFSRYIDESVLAQSNALFGYEGDKYYFDIDIRKHFGLDRYTDNTIPYWKTETVEAMDAFRFKSGYSAGAGECVSLATLYAAAAFIVAEIPLDRIFLMATPLHSQNFIDINDGIITNNRRIVTKTMWFNGTELSAKARRALENERITVVSHNSGYIHTLYEEATINRVVYDSFRERISAYLSTPITFEVLANFLRHNRQLQGCVQIEHACCGKPRYIEAEKVFHYEHSSKSRVGDSTQAALLHEIEEDEFYPDPIPNRLMLSELESFFKERQLTADNQETLQKLKAYLHNECGSVEPVFHDLVRFCHTVPRFPDEEKSWRSDRPEIELDGVTSAQEAQTRLEKLRSSNTTVDLAFSAFRDLDRSSWKPFLKAALERNPVSSTSALGLSARDIYNTLLSFGSESIYDGASRLAQPDEVWNYRHGDGLEKAICMMNILRSQSEGRIPSLVQESDGTVLVEWDGGRYPFTTKKRLPMPQKDDFSFAAG